LEGALKAGGVRVIVSIGSIDGQARDDGAVAVDIETNLDAAEFGRIKPDLAWRSSSPLGREVCHSRLQRTGSRFRLRFRLAESLLAAIRVVR
jgi:hypothetical protein